MKLKYYVDNEKQVIIIEEKIELKSQKDVDDLYKELTRAMKFVKGKD